MGTNVVAKVNSEREFMIKLMAMAMSDKDDAELSAERAQVYPQIYNVPQRDFRLKFRVKSIKVYAD